MTYLRKVVRGGKTYLYRYKSERVGKKVKSIYLGRELVTSKKKGSVTKIAVKKKRAFRKAGKSEKKLSQKRITSYLLQLDDTLNKINTHLMNDNIIEATRVYRNVLKVYSKVVNLVENEDRLKLYSKIKSVYENISSTAESLGYEIKK